MNLLNKARTALVAGDAHVAAKLYRKLIRAQPEMTTALLEGARAFTLSGNPEAARKALKKVESMTGLSTEIKSHIASGYFKLGDYEKAYDVLSTYWENDREIAIGIALVEVCERLRRLDQALKILEEIGIRHPRAPLMKGIILKSKGDIDNAVAALTLIESEKIKNVDSKTRYRASLILAECYEKQGRYKDSWDLVIAANKAMLPPAGKMDALDNEYRLHQEAMQRSMDQLVYPRPDMKPHPNYPIPLLVAGHPRSGTSIVSAHLAKKLNRVDIDEVPSFIQTLQKHTLPNKNAAEITPRECQIFQKDYGAAMVKFSPKLSPRAAFIDKNPGYEAYASYWMTLFPGTRIYLVRRHPLDCLLSCLFVYLPINHFSQQFLTPARASQSIEDSLNFQESLLETFTDQVEVIHYENFTREHKGDILEKKESEKAAFHSPNYGIVEQPVHRSSVERFRKYEEFLPTEIVKKWTQ
jgi:lipopolysaccharide biosynthesis regulator YciM